MNTDIALYNEAIKPYLTGAKQTCSYCDHLSPLILLEGRYTYITMAIGQIVPGYLQVCAQKHRTSATGFLPRERNEFQLMKRVVRLAYQEVYSQNGIAFEHGQAGTCMLLDMHDETEEDYIENSLCHHTHTHFVPVAVDIRAQIRDILPKEIKVSGLQDMIYIRNHVIQGGRYLYFEDVDAVGYVYPVVDTEIPRQFLRTCVADALGLRARADWVKYPGTEHFELTKTLLLPILNKYYKELKNEKIYF